MKGKVAVYAGKSGQRSTYPVTGNGELPAYITSPSGEYRRLVELRDAAGADQRDPDERIVDALLERKRLNDIALRRQEWSARLFAGQAPRPEAA